MQATIAAREALDTTPQQIERAIARRTWGRLRHLAIELTEDRVIVRGCAPSYYVKQLAIQACLEATESATPPQLDIDIVVATDSRQLAN